jgi:ribonuclease P protein component
MRLPSHLRLKQSSDFAHLRLEGRTQSSRSLVLSARPVETLPHFCFGLITGKKIGGAVERNTVRRRLREIIRKHQERLAPGWHWVLIARWRAPELTFAELEKDWLYVARRSGILRPDSKPPVQRLPAPPPP